MAVGSSPHCHRIAAIGAGVVVATYCRDLAASEGRLETVDRRLVVTDVGAIEDAERGSGDAVLVSHGVFGVTADCCRCRTWWPEGGSSCRRDSGTSGPVVPTAPGVS
jgi:hypothetical protein